MTRRYKPKGWRNESHRHSLAAKGISTKSPSMRETKYLAAKGISTRNRLAFAPEYYASKVYGPMTGETLFKYDVYNDRFKRVLFSYDNKEDAEFAAEQLNKNYAARKRRKINGRMVDISRKAMLKEVLELDEFSDPENIAIAQNLSNVELGAILGYWDVGDGGHMAAWKFPWTKDPLDEEVDVRIRSEDGQELTDKMTRRQLREIGEQVETGDGDTGIVEIEDILPTRDELAQQEIGGMSPEVAQLELAQLQDMREDGEIQDPEMADAMERRLQKLAGEPIS